MVEAYLRQSPLAHLGLTARGARDADNKAAGVVMTERTDRGQIVVRGNPTSAFLDAMTKAVSIAPPTDPNTVSGPQDLAQGARVLWLGPDEWLVVTAPGRGLDATAALRNALGKSSAAVTDVGDARAVIGLAGASARSALMKGCTLDLHPRAFGPGRCAQTLLARAGVILHQTAFDEGSGAASYDLYVLRSFAEYLWAWLEDAAREYGVRVDQI